MSKPYFYVIANTQSIWIHDNISLCDRYLTDLKAQKQPDTGESDGWSTDLTKAIQFTHEVLAELELHKLKQGHYFIKKVYCVA